MNHFIGNAILRAVSYFHVFKYPLREEEIWKYLPLTCEKETFKTVLLQLAQKNILFEIDGYYTLSNDPDLVQRRIKGFELAQIRIKKAIRIARFLGNFPFVNSVLISGSLSKDFALEDSDLDFLIITEADRLWVARSIMHVFKKLTFIAGAQHSFCMNYYISTKHPEISPKSIFTATELVTLKPAFAGTGIRSLFLRNEGWVKVLLPNVDFSFEHTEATGKKNLVARAIENILEGIGGNRLNNFLYRFTYNKWIRKWTRNNFDLEACKTCIGYDFNTPVNYPRNFPEKILNGYEAIYKEVRKKADSKLNSGSGDHSSGVHAAAVYDDNSFFFKK